ncbi:MAG: hypothetical protein GAK43_00815 [Stenotrophomonas maltophilia]|nr:MAG: hypothetical protein GAK43_00815 [Stenotrophomonas maltophilia]
MSETLWTFALRLYEQPGVETACLDLQAEGADVCLLLTGAWLGNSGCVYQAQHVSTLQRWAKPWREAIVVPLRELRIEWREAARADAELHVRREDLKRLELQAERILLERLAELSSEWPRGAKREVREWLQACAGEAGQRRRDALQVLGDATSELSA